MPIGTSSPAVHLTARGNSRTCAERALLALLAPFEPSPHLLSPRLNFPKDSPCVFGGFAKGWFPKGRFWRMFHSTQKPEQGYIRMFPGTKNRNKGAFGCSPAPKPERGHIRQNHPFTKPALLFPLDVLRLISRQCCYSNFSEIKSIIYVCICNVILIPPFP